MNSKVKKVFGAIATLLVVVSIGTAVASSLPFFSEPPTRDGFTHTVLVEVGTAQWCIPCHNWNDHMFSVYNSGEYDFEYVELIAEDQTFNPLNHDAWHRVQTELGISAWPTSYCDGEYTSVEGEEPSLFTDALNASGSRVVTDLDTSMTITWLGNATFTVDITIQNNELTTYNGYLRGYITERVSRYTTIYGSDYHYGFIGFAYNESISIGPGGVHVDSTTWNGNDHMDAKGNDFGDITADNIKVILSVFDDATGYAEETISGIPETTHTVLAEIGTAQWCIPCHNWNDHMFSVYNSGEYDFEYVELIAEDQTFNPLNHDAWHRVQTELGISAWPTSYCDGEYTSVEGEEPSLFTDALNASGGRAVADIDASMTVIWVGNATFNVDIVIKNNQLTTYNGYLRGYITEITSRYTTIYGANYHYGFIGYAFNKSISISPGGLYLDSVTWNGHDHMDAKGNDFGDITADNIKVILSVFDDATGYAEETIAATPLENKVLVHGSMSYSDMSPVLNADVDIVSLSTGRRYDTETDLYYYSLLLTPGEDINASETLRIIARDDTDMINVTEHTVTAQDIALGSIQNDLILDIHYLDLEEFPYYQAEDIPRNGLKSGAAVGKMFLDYFEWNSTIDPSGPPAVYTQQWIYDNFTSYDVPQEWIDLGLDWYEDSDYIDMYEMWLGTAWAVGEYGYHFWAHANTSSTPILKTICVMTDYTVPADEGHPVHVGAAIPAYGDYSNWMAIRGIHTSKNTWDPPTFPPFDIYGFWINDPITGGIGENTYKTVDELLATYLLPMDLPGDPFEDGQFTALVEPPEDFEGLHDDVEITIVNQHTGYSSFQKAMMRRASRMSMQHIANKIIYQTARASAEKVFTLAGKDINEFKPVQIIRVKSRVQGVDHYNLVVFSSGQEKLVVRTSMASGQFKELALSPEEPYFEGITTGVYRGGSPFWPEVSQGQQIKLDR